MRPINALTSVSTVNEWLANSRYPRILHVFDHACNLINERREVFSIVTPQIGNGPFNLVVEGGVLFSEHLNIESQISILENQIILGNLTIKVGNPKLWNPRPNWRMLHIKRDDIVNHLMKQSILDLRSPISQFSNIFLSSIATADLPSSLTAVHELAGLGIGLTPAGDDFITGALCAAWIIHPPEIASLLAKATAETAALLTTSLSAAWLRSAGRGAAGILWHGCFDALVSGNMQDIQESMERILAVGETSGADALSGFMGVLMAYKEKELTAHENSSR